jgi:hypothetical protein
MAKHRRRSRRELERQLLEAELVRRRITNAWLAFVLLVAVVSALFGLFGALGHLPEIRLSLTPLPLDGA